MASNRWDEASWRELDAVESGKIVAILPIGAIEAHGPHLPTGTDNLIARAMADEAARRLIDRAIAALVLPTVAFTAAPFAQGFEGTLSVRPATTTALIVDVGRALAAHGVATLAVANAHFDPANLGAIRAAIETLESDGVPRVVYPDLTRRPWVSRLTDEFRSGACHAGQYEGSVVLAVRPDLVDEERRQGLPAYSVSLSEAIFGGARSFEEIGGHQAYFGDPAAATADEGHRTIGVLGAILEEAVVEALAAAD